MRDLEANLQYEYMDKVRGYVKQQEEQIGRPLTFYVKTFGCQMNAVILKSLSEYSKI